MRRMCIWSFLAILLAAPLASGQPLPPGCAGGSCVPHVPPVVFVPDNGYGCWVGAIPAGYSCWGALPCGYSAWGRMVALGCPGCYPLPPALPVEAARPQPPAEKGK